MNFRVKYLLRQSQPEFGSGPYVFFAARISFAIQEQLLLPLVYCNKWPVIQFLAPGMGSLSRVPVLVPALLTLTETIMRNAYVHQA